MLVLSRKANESIIINDVIRVTVISTRGDRVRLGIEAPREVSVDRGEVHARKMQFIEVPVFCDGTVDLGGALALTADDTAH
jgi:carbon storage regulator